MKHVSPLEILRVMCERNMDIRMAPLDNILRMQTVKAGAQITIGADRQTMDALTKGGCVGGLLVANGAQYAALKAELESASISEG